MFTADAVTQLKCACFPMLKIDGILNLISILQWMSAKLQDVNPRKQEQLINALSELVSEIRANQMPVVTYTAASDRVSAGSHEWLAQSSLLIHRMVKAKHCGTRGTGCQPSLQTLGLLGA